MKTLERPINVVIGGPNGAGKTTISRAVLAETLGITEFVSADTLAAGLSGFDPERAAMAAGRIMLARLRELAANRESFAFESTLASRTFAPWLMGLREQGFEVHVLYVWLRTPELGVRRVKARLRRGGHGIPEDVVRQRYGRSGDEPLAAVRTAGRNVEGVRQLGERAAARRARRARVGGLANNPRRRSVRQDQGAGRCGRSECRRE
jgi:predicted ABC-type ATPase